MAQNICSANRTLTKLSRISFTYVAEDQIYTTTSELKLNHGTIFLPELVHTIARGILVQNRF